MFNQESFSFNQESFSVNQESFSFNQESFMFNQKSLSFNQESLSFNQTVLRSTKRKLATNQTWVNQHGQPNSFCKLYSVLTSGLHIIFTDKQIKLRLYLLFIYWS